MLKNYFKTAIRNLTRNRASSFINIFGLTAGLTCFFLIIIYIANELSYDRFNEKADRTYRVTRAFKEKDGSVNLHLPNLAAPFAPLIKSEFPELEQVARLHGMGMHITRGKEVFNERTYMADENIFDVLSVKFVKGDPRTALAEPFSAVITEEIAKKYFGDRDPIGQTFSVTSEKVGIKVTGIIKPLAKNSSFRRDIFISFKSLNDPRIGHKGYDKNFGSNNYTTFIVLPQNVSSEKIQARFAGFIDKILGKDVHKETGLYMQKLTDVHLYSSHLAWAEGDIKYVYIFCTIALLILVIACVNFINLSTAQSASRAKEIGIRKVSGAFKIQIVKQFLVETFIVCVVSTATAILLVIALLPRFNQAINKELSISELNFNSVVLFLMALIFLVSLTAGAYPAFFLAKFDPVHVLKGKLSSGSRNTVLRKVLVTFQFTITIFLLVGTLVIYRQMDYIQNKELGYNRDQVLYLDNDSSPAFESFKNELKRSAYVEQLGSSDQVPSNELTNFSGGIKASLDGRKIETPTVNSINIDYGFIPVYEFKLLAGRNFSSAFPTDSSSFIINESTSKSIGFANPDEAIGKEIKYGGVKGQIIGVVKDVYFEAMYNPIKPVIFLLDKNADILSIKFIPQNAKEVLAYTESTWKKHFPGEPFEYDFLSNDFTDLYQAEETREKVFSGFSIFSIFIACLGLFGLISYSISLRVKEIGIRKVLGAPIASIIHLLSKDYINLVFISNLFAWPIAYFVMNKWLLDFAYRIEWKWWYFALAGILAIMIAIVTISFQAGKTALANPIKSLRTE